MILPVSDIHGNRSVIFVLLFATQQTSIRNCFSCFWWIRFHCILMAYCHGLFSNMWLLRLSMYEYNCLSIWYLTFGYFCMYPEKKLLNGIVILCDFWSTRDEVVGSWTLYFSHDNPYTVLQSYIFSPAFDFLGKHHSTSTVVMSFYISTNVVSRAPITP